MGVTFHEFKFLEYITKSQTLGNVLTLGRQELILNENDLKKLNVIKNKNFVEKYSDKILIENFNATSITSLDNSNFEGASIVFDMNLPLKNLNRQFDTIIDFGTSEHIFNVPQSLQNVSDLCKKEGLILHCLPANNNCGHGFWQFSPELFFSLYSKKNGFLDTEIFLFDSYNKYEWWKINPQKPGERLELSSEVSLYVAVKTKTNIATFNDIEKHQSTKSPGMVSSQQEIDSNAGKNQKSLAANFEALQRLNPGIKIFLFNPTKKPDSNKSKQQLKVCLDKNLFFYPLHHLSLFQLI